MPFMSAPPSVETADQVLAVAQDLIDRNQEALLARPEGMEVSCRAGCTACCHQAVPVGPSEVVALDRAIDALEPAARERIRERITSTAAHLTALGFRSGDMVRRRDLASAYFDMQTPCPLLEDGTCAVRAARPLACREYLVVSDPVHCAATPSSATSVERARIVRIRSRVDVLTGHARIERDAGAGPPRILALALAEPRPEPLAMRRRSARELIEELCQPVSKPSSGDQVSSTVSAQSSAQLLSGASASPSDRPMGDRA